MGAYDGYKYAKKKKLKGWKKVAAIAGGAAIGAVNPFKIVSKAHSAYKAYKAAKYTKKVRSALKKSKRVRQTAKKCKTTKLDKSKVKRISAEKTIKKAKKTARKNKKTVKVNSAKKSKAESLQAVGKSGQTYSKKSDSSTTVSYNRPSHFRKGVREKVWEQAKNENGEVVDSVSGRLIDPKEAWDMGHKPGFEFWKHQKSAKERGISRKQFLDEHNISEHYRPELPSSNRSRKGENHTAEYLGP